MMNHFEADREAKKRWGFRGVAINGQRRMVGYFEDRTPDALVPRPPFPWVKCGEGATWIEAFDDADARQPASEGADVVRHGSCGVDVDTRLMESGLR